MWANALKMLHFEQISSIRSPIDAVIDGDEIGAKMPDLRKTTRM